jgi:peptidoglycan/xylan/chitin deacetylase (PgdA/CDA1 family)
MKACISIDMDNYQEYLSLLDPDQDHESRSFYLDAIPRFLDLLDAAGAKATFFMVGRDARVDAHRPIIRDIASRGHEVSNHSYSHPYNFRGLSRAQKEEEVRAGEEAIADVLGERSVGFRTPSCDVDLELLGLLEERGYHYDSSIFPSPMMWAFMLYGKLFVRRDDYQLGPALAAFAPRVPYEPCPDRIYRRRRAGDTRSPAILEIPFSVLPFVRIPFYSTFLRRFGPRAFEWMQLAYGQRTSLLHVVFHIIELAEFDDTPLGQSYERVPGLAASLDRRFRFITGCAEAMGNRCEFTTLRAYAAAYRSREAEVSA